MKGRIRKAWLPLAILAVLAIGVAVALAAWLGLRRGASRGSAGPEVTINAATWRVELATTEMQQYRGLGGRRSLSQGTGMLFIFPSARVLDFCMRDCFIPIDIAFLDSDRRVVATYTMTVEPDHAGRATYSSGVPARFALEVPAGELARAKVALGDRAMFSREVLAATKGRLGP